MSTTRRKSRKRRKRKSEATTKQRAATRTAIPMTARDHDAGKWFAKLVALQAKLRAPNGCPWDREQTHDSLRKFLIEEAYEVLDAMDSGDRRKFAGELGDLLLQIVFHAILAEESGSFTMSDVIESVHSKMVRRHPHVFGGAEAATSAAVLKNWEQIKAEERAAENKKQGKAAKAEAKKSILAGVPNSLPGVLEAYQLTRRASHIGFDWRSLAGVLAKLDEERREIQAALPKAAHESQHGARAEAKTPTPQLEEEVGDLLFAGVNVARFLGVDPEIALKKANRKFKKRFQWMEAAAAREGKQLADVPRERMEQLWDESKTRASKSLAGRIEVRTA